mmetsp:Transcript_60501/g.179299  ORF Transcript_60501/g.179299 Transcript_60501/m.179299 type:complete len:217 (-) Transcript_60501:210-860(-)
MFHPQYQPLDGHEDLQQSGMTRIPLGTLPRPQQREAHLTVGVQVGTEPHRPSPGRQQQDPRRHAGIIVGQIYVERERPPGVRRRAGEGRRDERPEVLRSVLVVSDPHGRAGVTGEGLVQFAQFAVKATDARRTGRRRDGGRLGGEDGRVEYARRGGATRDTIEDGLPRLGGRGGRRWCFRRGFLRRQFSILVFHLHGISGIIGGVRHGIDDLHVPY